MLDASGEVGDSGVNCYTCNRGMYTQDACTSTDARLFRTEVRQEAFKADMRVNGILTQIFRQNLKHRNAAAARLDRTRRRQNESPGAGGRTFGLQPKKRACQLTTLPVLTPLTCSVTDHSQARSTNSPRVEASGTYSYEGNMKSLFRHVQHLAAIKLCACPPKHCSL